MKEFCLADGRRLTYREAGAGRPLILLHGWAMSSAVFQEVLDEFAADFRVLAPDLRGHGGSDAGVRYGFTDFADDLGEWLHGLDLREAAALGWSLGGQVLLELYPRAKERLSRLLFVGTTPCFTAGPDWPAGLPEVQVRAMGRDLRRNYLKAMGDFFSLQFAGEVLPPERYRRIAEFAVRDGRLPDPAVALAALETLRAGDLRPRVAAIGCPCHVLHGEADRITLPAAGRWLAANAPTAQLEILPAVGHAPFLSRPAEVYPLWRAFLR